jgi:hypothetical protein
MAGALSQFGTLLVFLWRYHKSIVYNDKRQTLQHLKNKIYQAITDISVDMLERVERNVEFG